jgi:tetratricopeptide (TPR) repeat protein
MKQWWRIVALVAAVTLVYANTLRNSFTYDDFPYILNNAQVTSPTLKGFFAATIGSNVFRPLTFATFSFNWLLGTIHPAGYHLLNLMLHAAVTLLLYFLLCKLLEGVLDAELIAFAAALLFAVLPIHTEAVASITGRSELLAAGFVFAAWLLHLQGRPWAALACFALALLSKESAVAFVPLAVAGDYLRGKWKPAGRYAAIVAVAMLYVAVLWKVQGGRFGEISTHFVDNPLVGLSATWRVLNALRVAWKYVGLQVYPAVLSSEYSYNAIPTYTAWRYVALPALAALVAIVLWIWALWSKRTGWALAGTIYLAGFAVTSNIFIPTGTIMGERLAYLPSAGLCLLAALLWAKLADQRRAFAWSLLGIVLLVFGLRAIARNEDWRSNFTLFSATVRAVPGSARAHSDIAGQYMDQGKLELARAEFQNALDIYPDLPDALELYGLIEAREGHDDKALALLRHALVATQKSSTRYDEREITLAAMFIKLGQDDQALPLLDDSIGRTSGNSRARSNRAVIRYRRGEMDGARSDAEIALQTDASNAQARGILSALASHASLGSTP